jgi:hypothetical protein
MEREIWPDDNMFALRVRVGFAHLLDQLATKAEDIEICPYQKLIRSALCFRESFLRIPYHSRCPMDPHYRVCISRLYILELGLFPHGIAPILQTSIH